MYFQNKAPKYHRINFHCYSRSWKTPWKIMEHFPNMYIGVQAYRFGKKDFELGVGRGGQDTSRHFEGGLGPYVQYWLIEASEQKIGQKSVFLIFWAQFFWRPNSKIGFD